MSLVAFSWTNFSFAGNLSVLGSYICNVVKSALGSSELPGTSMSKACWSGLGGLSFCNAGNSTVRRVDCRLWRVQLNFCRKPHCAEAWLSCEAGPAFILLYQLPLILPETKSLLT